MSEKSVCKNYFKHFYSVTECLFTQHAQMQVQYPLTSFLITSWVPRQAQGEVSLLPSISNSEKPHLMRQMLLESGLKPSNKPSILSMQFLQKNKREVPP